jgi:hypothetical protein
MKTFKLFLGLTLTVFLFSLLTSPFIALAETIPLIKDSDSCRDACNDRGKDFSWKDNICTCIPRSMKLPATEQECSQYCG